MKKIKALLALLVVAAMMVSCNAETTTTTDASADEGTDSAAEAVAEEAEEVTEADTEAATEEVTEAEVVEPVETSVSDAYTLENGTPIVKVVSTKYPVGDGCYIEFIPHARYWSSWNNWITSYGLEIRYTGACETDAALAAKYNFNNVTACTEYYHYNVTINYSISNENLTLVDSSNYAENSEYIQSITFDGWSDGEELGPTSAQCIADNDVEGTITFETGDSSGFIIEYGFIVFTDTEETGDYTDDYIESWINNIETYGE